MIHTRVSASAAVLALVAASVFLGAGAAQAEVINPPVITTANGNTVDQTPLILGTVDNPNARDLTVQVYVTNGGGTSNYCQQAVPYTSSTFGALWGCSGPAVPYGTNTFTAVVWEDFEPGAVSGSSNAAVLTVGGTQPAVLAAPTPGAVTSDATPAFSGTGPSLGLIDVNNGAGTSFCVTAVDAAGNWACDATSALPPGVYTVQADPTWIDGSPDAGTTPQSLEIVAPPAPTVDQTFAPWTTSGETASIQGNKDVDVSYIQVYSSPDGITWTGYCQATGVIGSTVWYCDPPFGTLSMGTNQLAAIAFNEAGDASAQGPAITIERVPPPVLVTPADGSVTNDSTPTFSGQAGSGDANVWGPDEMTFCSTPIVAGEFSCESGPLADGTYTWFVEVTPGSWIISDSHTFTVDTIAAAPVITGPASPTTSRTPVITGTGEVGATVVVYRDGSPVACQEPAVVNAAGAWSCATTDTLLVGNTYGFGAKQTDSVGNVSTPGVPPIQRFVSITAVSETQHPLPTLTFEPWVFEFGIGGSEFERGDTTEVTGSGLPAGATVDIEFHSTPVALGSTVVDADGAFSKFVTIPEDAEPGEHKFVVTVTPLEGLPSTQEQPVTVMVPVKEIPAVEEEDEEVEPSSTTDDGADGDVTDRDDPAAPSSLTGSITTLASILSNPVVVGTAALAGLALLLLVAFPAELLNSTLSEQYPRFSRRVPKVPWLTRFTNWLETTPLFGGIAITFVAAYIFGFADPDFGFDITSFRVVLSCAIALFIVGYLASSIAGVIIGRRWNLATAMELKPLGLLLTIAGVALSRALEFSPGFLIGLLLGIGLVGRTTAVQQAKATLVQAGVVLAIALLGWVGYSILTATIAPDTFLNTLTLDTLVVITTEGLTALFIGLLPFRFLDGAAIYAYSKVIWAAAFTVVAAAFVLIVVPSAWGELDGSLWMWIAIVGGFAAVALGIYLYFRFWAPPIEDPKEEPATEKTPSLVE